MISLDGAPLPAAPDPPGDVQITLGGVFLFFLFVVLVYIVLCYVRAYLEESDERAQELRIAKIQNEREEIREKMLQHLIEMSPGGRKPWQDRRGVS